MLAQKLLSGGEEKIYVDDVFSAYTYTGNGSTQTITNGIDLAGKGGLVWLKRRVTAGYNNELYDTIRGVTKYLQTDGTISEGTAATGLTAFGSDGFTLGGRGNTNENAATYVGWTFRKSPKFFDVQTKAHTTGSSSTVDLSILGTVGMVIVKRYSASGDDWPVFHRSLSAGKILYLDATNAEFTSSAISLSGTTLTINSGNATGDYIIYAWAHDTSTDGIIQCGSFTTDGSGNATVNLGWEPQYLMFKISGVNPGDWNIYDQSRGWTADGSNDQLLLANSSASETSGGRGYPSANGFTVKVQDPYRTYIYLAIRRPNKPPTSGTQVYNAAISQVGKVPAYDAGWPVDLAWRKDKTGSNSFAWSRLTGGTNYLKQDLTSSETSWGSDVGKFDSMTSWFNQNENSVNFVSHMFRRAVGVHDQVCYTGTGVAKTEAHGLGVVPELMIVKARSVSDMGWMVYSNSIGNTYRLILNSNLDKQSPNSVFWNSTSPTATSFSIGSYDAVNTSTANYTAYLFATKAGISKVGSYAGNGSSQTINAGFSTGCRFFMCKRTDSTGDWYVWSSTTGIIAGNDPHLSLNTTAAEVTTDDSVDNDNSGIIVNQVAATNINVNAAAYIYLAYA